MEILFNELMDKITHIVLDEDYEEYHDLYTIRLQFLYSLILEEVSETGTPDKLEALVDEITNFEISQQYITLTSLENFQNILPETALSIFSSTAFGLAVEYLKGKTHASIAGFLKEAFNALIDDNAIISETVLLSNRLLISETLLDFNFAIGESEIMSFRLKRQWDSMR